MKFLERIGDTAMKTLKIRNLFSIVSSSLAVVIVGLSITHTSLHAGHNTDPGLHNAGFEAAFEQCATARKGEIEKSNLEAPEVLHQA